MLAPESPAGTGAHRLDSLRLFPKRLFRPGIVTKEMSTSARQRWRERRTGSPCRTERYRLSTEQHARPRLPEIVIRPIARSDEAMPAIRGLLQLVLTHVAVPNIRVTLSVRKPRFEVWQSTRLDCNDLESGDSLAATRHGCARRSLRTTIPGLRTSWRTRPATPTRSRGGARLRH